MNPERRGVTMCLAETLELPCFLGTIPGRITYVEVRERVIMSVSVNAKILTSIEKSTDAECDGTDHDLRRCFA